MFSQTDPIVLILAVPGFVIALAFHEWAHAFTADLFGDTTPRRQGRLTIDPRAHLDLFGTLMLVLVGFGWAKPVMVNPKAFRNRFWGDVVVSSAGIIMNLLLAVVFTWLYVLLSQRGIRSAELLQAFGLAARINVLLAAFNFIPIPPLDGYRVASRLIPGFHGSSVQRFLDQFGMFFLMLILFLMPGVLQSILNPLMNSFYWLVRQTVGLLLGLH